MPLYNNSKFSTLFDNHVLANNNEAIMNIYRLITYFAYSLMTKINMNRTQIRELILILHLKIFLILTIQDHFI